ncbi:sugar-transfer associated ATP-grasp domain-containing protein [Arenibacter certesii]|uniref:Alpha-L-glutamate ligase-related protein ATP-grasp domain-containing protein n=1 Tax=Arenibacter certesii TaxID=228955 RepID=A0A918MMH2_9FLAO|nr:sugar-transfer associated ATP-grasp domain-containing protein [Arenibacter certesii]GGW38684.1 hypothetical protein GCM10007383_24280 [Arenibacter certesii]
MHFDNPERIKVFLKNPNKKNYLKICKEVLVLWVTKKEVPMYYFKHLYKREIKNYKDYLGTKEAAEIREGKKLHQLEFTSILCNKLNFSLYCERSNIPTPKLIGHNLGNHFFSGSEMRKINNKTELIAFYEAIFESTQLETLFFRPLSQYGGKGIFKLRHDNIEAKLESEYQNLINGNYLYNEVITQHPKLNAIHGTSINSLRILTYIHNGEVNIISSIFRLGTAGAVVDNTSSGGLFIGIDDKTETLKKEGYRNLEFGGEVLTKHPDTNFEFLGFKMPYYKEACELVKKATAVIPNRLIGWDVAITPTGPIIIEGNAHPDLFAADVAYGGLLKNKQIQRIKAFIK